MVAAVGVECRPHAVIILGFCQFTTQKSGAAEGTRTPDPIITNDVLYQLSYSGLW